MRTFFASELESAATIWRIYRRDGIALGFTSHDRDLVFAGLRHRAAPGMVPSAVRMTADLSEDSADVEGALSHESIRIEDLAAGLFDDASIGIGIVDWETLEHTIFYTGTIGRIEDDTRGFSAELRSAKALLEEDLVPRTSPTCRAIFCGPGCALSAARFSSTAALSEIDVERNAVRFDNHVPADLLDGEVRFLDGPQTGLPFAIVSVDGDWLTLDRVVADGLAEGTMAELREGCDHTIATCSGRFDNAVNFRGEPFLPGNDLLARYGRPGA
ncbi:MAG: DUF2163 domain-containing protein [Erythrobacter sp.]|jgi:uncharacterized phage protein (TIGR02218 family)|nr:DUF2163 domain-containing protein [Erythrobacter sp.]